ncbi:hypothetical protein EJB05_46629 [Eragrostis curvula]|uniref:Glutamine cyclotransferase n=1 Tax=Eragrostis curvula TaxID=38414 RepID=A0A5J9TNM9_9POAL|nr:hypothetical protein EJB05_46629 [Eragrostis curvula]
MTMRSSTSPPQLYLCRPAIAAAALLLLAVVPCGLADSPKPTAPHRRPAARFYSFDQVHEYPHDQHAFTEGLLYGGNDTLFESTGLYNQSSVRKVDLRTGKVLVQEKMDGRMFGEGLTLLGNKLFQLTWMSDVGFIYDRHNFSKRESFSHKMSDGWGLATDGKVLFGSDGTSTLYQLDPKSLEVVKMVTVKYHGNEVSYLNELEYVNGEVWANVLPTDCIVRVSPNDGQVVGWIFLHELKQHLLDSGNTDIDVLNGIAWDGKNHRVFVTGKLWPKLYEIKLRPVNGPPNGSVEELCPKLWWAGAKRQHATSRL